METKKINELLISLENQLNINFNELSIYQEKGKLPLHIINKKRKFLTDVYQVISACRTLLHSTKPAPIHPTSTPDQIYMSDILRHSRIHSEKEAARNYSISKTKAQFPELY